jgi:hypothetical protein
MNKVFTGGVPYSVDVNRLIESFPADGLEEGRVITHEELEASVGLQRGAQRYYGVINSWISKIKSETGIFMVWEQGDGVRVLAPSGVLEHAETITRQKIKQTKRAVNTFAWVKRDRLNEVGRQRLDHVMRVGNAIKESIDSARRQLAVELAPVKSLPKRKDVA